MKTNTMSSQIDFVQKQVNWFESMWMLCKKRLSDWIIKQEKNKCTFQTSKLAKKNLYFLIIIPTICKKKDNRQTQRPVEKTVTINLNLNDYVGKTKRHFLVHIFEHLRISLSMGNNYTYNP